MFVLTVLGEGLGYETCVVLGRAPPHPVALAGLAGAAALTSGLGAVMIRRQLRGSTASQAGLDQQVATQLEQQRRLRHDLRGALSPALLTADRLINHADPKVRRAGEIMVQSVERASSLLTEPTDVNPPGVSPPGGP